MTSISTSRHDYGDTDSHVQVSVFAGPDREHRANVGILTFRLGEEDEFIRRVEDIYQGAPPIVATPPEGGPRPTDVIGTCGICGGEGVCAIQGEVSCIEHLDATFSHVFANLKLARKQVIEEGREGREGVIAEAADLLERASEALGAIQSSLAVSAKALKMEDLA